MYWMPKSQNKGGVMHKILTLLTGIFISYSSFSCIVYEESQGRTTWKYGYIKTGDEIFYGSYLETKALTTSEEPLKTNFRKLRKTVGADPQTFQELNQCYGADKDRIYYQGVEFVSNDDFQILGSYDSDITYRDGNVEHIKDYVIKTSDSVYDGLKFVNLEAPSFKLLYAGRGGIIYAQDKTGIYYKGEKKIDGFPVKDDEYKIAENSGHIYLITKYRVYMEDKLIKEADPKTFGIFDDGVFPEISKDKKNYYKNGEKMTSQEVDKFFKIKNEK